MPIHALAVVHPGAVLGADVKIGAFACVGDDVRLGAGCVIMNHATVLPGVRLGERCQVHPGAVIGGDPQNRAYAGERTFLEVGARTIFREYVTVSRATKEGGATRIGSDCLLMMGAHVGHDSVVGDRVTIANGVNVAGHCELHDDATIGGVTALHQFVRVGTMAMVGGQSGLTRDAPPFMLTAGAPPAMVYGLNRVGLARNGSTGETRRRLKHAFRLLYRSGLNLTQALERIRAELPVEGEIAVLVAFIAGSRRGLSNGSRWQRERRLRRAHAGSLVG